jgi:hypothetical protein
MSNWVPGSFENKALTAFLEGAPDDWLRDEAIQIYSAPLNCFACARNDGLGCLNENRKRA